MTDMIPPPTDPNPSLSSYALMNPPDKVAAYFLQHQDPKTDRAHHLSFAEFIANMDRTKYDDFYDIRAILESQAQMLGAVFQYVLLDGDWRNLPFALRAQKMMLDTIDVMNAYPSLAYRDDILRRIRAGEI